MHFRIFIVVYFVYTSCKNCYDNYIMIMVHKFSKLLRKQYKLCLH